MTTRSRLAFGVRVLLGGVPDEPLPSGMPEHLIYEVLQDEESGMLVDLNLSDQNRRVSKKVFNNLTADSFAVNASDFGAPAFAQLKVSPEDTFYTPVEIVNRASIDQAGMDNRLAVAFYGVPTQAQLSWLPQDTPGQQLVVWYDKTVDVDGALSDSPPIEDAYTAHLKLRATARLISIRNRARVEAGLPVMQVDDELRARIATGEQQWQRSVKMSRQQGLVQKPSSHPRAGRRVGSFRAPGGAIIR